jgi:hypothetical protein
MDSTINTEKPYELMTLHELFAVKVQMHKVASSQIDEIGYDPDSKVLAVKFMKGGEFRYVRVHESLYSDLQQSESIDSTFAKTIRPFYFGNKPPVTDL